MIFKNKRGTSILIVGLVFFFFMTILAILIMSIVERLEFGDVYAGYDAQRLTDGKYTVKKIEFFIERSSDIFFKKSIEDVNLEDLFKSMDSDGGIYSLESIDSGQSYDNYVKLYNSWLVNSYADFILKISSEISFKDLPISFAKIDYSVVEGPGSIIGFYSGFILPSTVNKPGLKNKRYSEYVDLNSNSGRIYYKPHFSIEAPLSGFGDFITSMKAMRVDADLGCAYLDDISFPPSVEINSVLTVQGVRIVSLISEYSDLKFGVEFECSSAVTSDSLVATSSGPGLSIPDSFLEVPVFDDLDFISGDLPDFKQVDLCIPDIDAIQAALETISSFEVIFTAGVDSIDVFDKTILRPDDCGVGYCKSTVQIADVDGGVEIIEVNRVVETSDGKLVNIVSEKNLDGTFEQTDAFEIAHSFDSIDLGSYSKELLKSINSAVLLDMHKCGQNKQTSGVILYSDSGVDYLVGVKVNSLKGVIEEDIESMCAPPWELTKAVVSSKKKFDAIIPPNYDFLLKGDYLFPIPDEFKGDMVKKIKVEANSAGESEVVEIKVVDETGEHIFEDTYVPNYNGGWTFVETKQVESAYKGFLYDDSVYEGPVILVDDFDTSCSGVNTIDSVESVDSYTINFIDDGGTEQNMQNVVPDSSGFYLVLD